MARNKIKFTSGVVFIALLIGANILLLMPQEHTKEINYFFVKITSPITKLFNKAKPANDDTVPKSEYLKLLQEHENMQVRTEEIKANYRKMSGIRQKMPLPGPALVMAKVSKIIVEGQRNEIVISKGSRDGLRKGQYVLSAEIDPEMGPTGSVIGTIVELSKTMSRVQLVTDAAHHIMVDIWRDGEALSISGYMNGNNKLQAEIPLIPRQQFDIRVEDSIFAKIKRGLLETSMVIGKVTEIKPLDRDPHLWDITITPLVDIKSLTDVAVVVIDMKTSDGSGGE
jgi:cell shape-determining protein MreC